MVESPKKIYGVLGYPVKHSLSPSMHNAAFQALGLQNECEYKLFEVAPGKIDSFIDGLDNNNIYGLNITVPYKEKILDYVCLDAQEIYLSQIGAVNTIVKRDGVWRGLNTDIPGFTRHLKENFEAKHKKVAILGAGGAARAVSFALAQAQAAEIAIYDIDKTKASRLVKMIKDLFPSFPIYQVFSVDELEIGKRDLLINCTPVGLKDSDPCLIKEEMLHKDLFVYDLIYNPAQTKLLSLAKNKGCKASNGLGMLLYQGMLSFEIWTGKSAPQSVMHDALKGYLQSK